MDFKKFAIQLLFFQTLGLKKLKSWSFSTSRKFKLGLENSISSQNQITFQSQKSKIQITAWVNPQVNPKLNPKPNACHQIESSIGSQFQSWFPYYSTKDSWQGQNSNLKSNQMSS